jgi:hypothetical protein
MKSVRFCLFLVLLLSDCKKEELPIIKTADISSITQTSAICGGYIISQGSSELISKGICWATSTEPTIQDDTITVEGYGIGSFTTKLTGLELNTTYFVRAYATNSIGTGYGGTKSFTTDPPYLPKVKTFGFSSITKTSAKSGGKVTSDGASEIIDRGICWSKSQYPSSSELSNNSISVGPGSGPFYATITGLESNTDYFVWAYATNLVGTGYGEPRLCTTGFEPDPNIPVDPNYPTTFNRLDSTTLSERRTAFTERNKYIVSTLNEFGFCTGGGRLIHPPHQDNITQQDVIETVKNFALLNPAETGIENPDELTFTHISHPTSSSGDILWILESSSQKIETKEVIGSKIYFWVMNKEVVTCTGNWYPHIYIPQNFYIDQEQAKLLLIGRVVMHYGFAGDKYYVKILAEYLNSSSVKLSIVPFNHDNKIELRVTWQIKVPAADYKLFVDVMTGEIVYKEPTMIS